MENTNTPNSPVEMRLYNLTDRTISKSRLWVARFLSIICFVGVVGSQSTATETSAAYIAGTVVGALLVSYGIYRALSKNSDS